MMMMPRVGGEQSISTPTMISPKRRAVNEEDDRPTDRQDDTNIQHDFIIHILYLLTSRRCRSEGEEEEEETEEKST